MSSVHFILDNTSAPEDGQDQVSFKFPQSLPLIEDVGANANQTGAGKRATKASFTPNDCVRFIHARTILDHHYDQRINSAQTKLQFFSEKYNQGCDVPAKFVDGAANDIHFEPLRPTEYKTEAQLQRKWEAMSKILRDILISTQEQSILNGITKRTHAKGEKKDAAELRILICEDIEKEKRKFGYFELMIACQWEKRDIMNPKPRLSVSYANQPTTSASAAALPAIPAPSLPAPAFPPSSSAPSSPAPSSPAQALSQDSPVALSQESVSSTADSIEDAEEEAGKRKVKGRM